jgi:hypothetical protein
MSQRCALRQHCCKALCSGWSDVIVADIEVSQHWALRQHSCKALCTLCSNVIVE